MRGLIIAAASIGGIGIAAWAANARVSRDIDEAFGDFPFLPEGVRTAANGVGGLQRESGQRSSAVGSQTSIQNNSLQNPGSMTGQAAK